MTKQVFDGKVALVTEGGSELGRTIALALAARGARVVVVGEEERALGETVGEIAYGGGKARHVVGGADGIGRAVDRALEVFGGLDLVVASTASVLLPAKEQLRDGGRLVLLAPEAAPLRELTRETAGELAARRSTCSGIVLAPELEADDAAELVVLLCSRPRAFRGQVVAVA